MTRKNWLELLAMLLIGGLITWYSLRDVSLSLIWNDLISLHWGWLILALFCMCVYLGMEAVVLKIFTHDRYPDFSWKDAIRVPLVEQLFNGLTPFSTGGQPAQLVAMMQAGIDGGRASSVLLMKFVIFQGMIVLNFLFSMIFGFHYLASKIHALSFLVLFGFIIHTSVIIGLLLVMYWYKFTKKIANGILQLIGHFVSKERYDRWHGRLNEMIDSFYHESLQMKQDKKRMLKVALMTMIQLGFYYVIPYFILLALGVKNANFMLAFCMHVLIFMCISLFPIPGGAGGAEFSFAVIFSSFVNSHAKLILAMLLWRVLTYYFGMFAGMFAMFVKADKVDSSEND